MSAQKGSIRHQDGNRAVKFFQAVSREQYMITTRCISPARCRENRLGRRERQRARQRDRERDRETERDTCNGAMRKPVI